MVVLSLCLLSLQYSDVVVMLVPRELSNLMIKMCFEVFGLHPSILQFDWAAEEPPHDRFRTPFVPSPVACRPCFLLAGERGK